MKILEDFPNAMLQYNEETNAMELIWKKMHDVDTYKHMFEKGIEYLHDYQATGWLSDIRNEGVVSPDTSKWLQEEIIPKAISYGLQRIAIVMDSDIFKKFYVQNVTNSTKNQLMKHFDSLESAQAWLKETAVMVSK